MHIIQKSALGYKKKRLRGRRRFYLFTQALKEAGHPEGESENDE